ncbi:hypothetical protein CUS_6026 [Ruminococcus albus 8]|uniref:Uncharacterized protein n=1 Tax=Ruminococcus albus 8 TaxID=246199 RepID=E9SD14_RUMAL|nr:hypothetical protein CUS_6026 [Ruminococcus albus 8]
MFFGKTIVKANGNAVIALFGMSIYKNVYDKIFIDHIEICMENPLTKCYKNDKMNM